MTKNKKLTEALDKAQKIKQDKKDLDDKKYKTAKNSHDEHIKSYIPRATKWIDSELYDRITKAEVSGYDRITLNQFEGDGIPAEAIFEAAQKIKGLRPCSRRYPIYENAEFVGETDIEYSIGWDLNVSGGDS